MWSVSDRLMGVINMSLRYESLYKEVGRMMIQEISFSHYISIVVHGTDQEHHPAKGHVCYPFKVGSRRMGSSGFACADWADYFQ